MNQEFNPEWLLKIKKTGKIPDKIPFEKVLQRALFYPACDDDFKYIYFFTKSSQNIINSIIRDEYYYNKESIFFNKRLLLSNDKILSILKDVSLIDTYIFADYKGSDKSFDKDLIRSLLSTLSEEYNLICEKYIKTYKIDKKNSSDTAFFINETPNIEELIYCYKNDKKRYNEIFAKFKREKLKDNKIHWIFNEEEPFVHWSVWEDSSSGKLFNVIYFIEEAHVNFLRTFIKHECCPKILVLHNYGESYGFAWTYLDDERYNFIKLMYIAGSPDYLVFETHYTENFDDRWFFTNFLRSEGYFNSIKEAFYSNHKEFYKNYLILFYDFRMRYQIENCRFRNFFNRERDKDCLLIKRGLLGSLKTF